MGPNVGFRVSATDTIHPFSTHTSVGRSAPSCHSVKTGTRVSSSMQGHIESLTTVAQEVGGSHPVLSCRCVPGQNSSP